jgi:DNA-directed RNA polymerase subunit H (RpoH/RPB5)
MTTVSSNRILSIYKSRNIILEVLESLEYNIEEYGNFSINEIDAMFVNSQLDILLNHTTEDKKVYIKYNIFPKQTSKQIKTPNLQNIVKDLFQIEKVLTKNDTLIIIIDDEPNDSIKTTLRYLYDHDGIFVVIHNIKRLQQNILKHVLVPKMKILKNEEIEVLKTKYNIKDLTQLSEISRFDPTALLIMLRPNQVCLYMRSSQTAIDSIMYSVCV